jgi:hypothetical protein
VNLSSPGLFFTGRLLVLQSQYQVLFFLYLLGSIFASHMCLEIYQVIIDFLIYWNMILNCSLMILLNFVGILFIFSFISLCLHSFLVNLAKCLSTLFILSMKLIFISLILCIVLLVYISLI